MVFKRKSAQGHLGYVKHLQLTTEERLGKHDHFTTFVIKCSQFKRKKERKCAVFIVSLWIVYTMICNFVGSLQNLRANARVWISITCTLAITVACTQVQISHLNCDHKYLCHCLVPWSMGSKGNSCTLQTNNRTTWHNNKHIIIIHWSMNSLPSPLNSFINSSTSCFEKGIKKPWQILISLT